MATLKNKALFFTTSPRTPSKMIPEIELLSSQFAGQKWNTVTQIAFIDALASSDFFEGVGSPKDKAFSARDRINRAPKALGLIDLYPTVQITEGGEAFIHGRRPQNAFLRQLLKFQLPSPYHIESKDITGSFYIKPYLEIFRLIRELGYLTFDEIKIFAVQLIDYRKFGLVKNAILQFRALKDSHRGNYKELVQKTWDNAVENIYADEIRAGNTRTRQSTDNSLKKFFRTKQSNLRDYTDACFRYLRFTGLVSISYKGRSISIFDDKIDEVDYFLSNVNRNPVFIDDIAEYKKYLFNPKLPMLFCDQKENVLDKIMRISDYSRNQLLSKTIDELNNIREEIIQAKREIFVQEQVAQLKSYALYSEVIDTFNEIISDELYDAPLMLEWNTWRAMTMLDGGHIKGNFRVDDAGQPMSTAQGNMPDIECDYGNFALSVEVTMQSGQRQYETEGEPVARHYGQLKKKSGKDTYCLFIAPTINRATLAHFYGLNKIDIGFYGGKSKIIPLELDLFMKLVENSYSYKEHPNVHHVKELLDHIIELTSTVSDEIEWSRKINECANNWLAA